MLAGAFRERICNLYGQRSKEIQAIRAVRPICCNAVASTGTLTALQSSIHFSVPATKAVPTKRQVRRADRQFHCSVVPLRPIGEPANCMCRVVTRIGWFSRPKISFLAPKTRSHVRHLRHLRPLSVTGLMVARCGATTREAQKTEPETRRRTTALPDGELGCRSFRARN